MTTRLYLPMTLAQLARVHETGAVPPDVSRDGAETTGAGADEVEEYDALQRAADVSAGLLDGPGRRVVVVAEVASVDAEVPVSRVVAVHVDDADVDPAAYDDPPELGWWATQEIGALLEG